MASALHAEQSTKNLALRCLVAITASFRLTKSMVNVLLAEAWCSRLVSSSISIRATTDVSHMPMLLVAFAGLVGTDS